MSTSQYSTVAAESSWVRFWHEPVRGERLAILRITVGLAMLGDQLLQYLPNFEDFFGPDGVAPAALHAAHQHEMWRITYLFFGTDNLVVLRAAFWLLVACTALFLVGWQTRWMNFLCWLLTRCFVERNPSILTSGDDVLQIVLLLLLLSPCGAALSIDAWWKRRAGLQSGPVLVPPWQLRVIQIQLCLIYCTTGLVKLRGEGWLTGTGTWWEGTSLHYYLNDSTMWRWSYAQLPIPFWITMPLTYFTMAWEVLFPWLVLWRWTRPLALFIGVCFHLGILMVSEVGWFGLYTLALYTVWIPDSFWRKVCPSREAR